MFCFTIQSATKQPYTWKSRLLKTYTSKFRDKKETELIKKKYFMFCAIMRRSVRWQVKNNLLALTAWLITTATMHLLWAPSHYFQNSFWDRFGNFSPQNSSLYDISGTDITKKKCQHTTTLNCFDTVGWSPQAQDLA